MIQDIFITDLAGKVLYGNSRLLPAIVDSVNTQGSECYSPVIAVKDKKLSKLQVNNVVLSILYTNIDNFTASKFLLDLKNFIEDRISKIDCSTVQKNYFILLDMLQDVELVFPGAKPKRSDLIKTENVYIDVVEDIYSVMDVNGGIIKNQVQGKILSNDSSYKIILENGEAKIKTFFEETQDGIELLCLDNRPMSFVIDNYKNVPFKMVKQGNYYIFDSSFKAQFKDIEIVIPVGKSAYSVKTLQRIGTTVFDMNGGILKWKISNKAFNKEKIKIEVNSLESETETRSIMVNFIIEDIQEPDVKIKRCQAIGETTRRFWVKYTIQSGHYEIRQ